ncbi:hypothetical protein PWT90_08824 [Aphanocladium album]|nr:hypothetical protein PWT90_08824 [Aphanocladium album]
MDPLSIGADSAALRTQCEILVAFTRTLLTHGVRDSYRTLPQLDKDVGRIWVVLSAINLFWCSFGSALMEDSISDWHTIHNILMGTKLAVQGLLAEIEPVVRAGDGGQLKRLFSQNWAMGKHSTAMATYGARVNRHLAGLEVGLTMIRLVMEHREGKPVDQSLELANLQNNMRILESAAQSAKKPFLPTAKENNEHQLEYICSQHLLGAAKTLVSHYSRTEIQQQKQDAPVPELPFPEAAPLHLAARAANLAEVKRLIASGAAVSVRCNNGQTPVYAAVLSGDTAVADYIIQQGGDFKTTTIEGWAPLHAAAADGHVNLVKLLLSHGADPCLLNGCGQSPVYVAAANGHLEALQTLVENGVSSSDSTDPKHWTPLNAAVFNGHLTIVQYLLSQGADPNIPQEEGWTPLHYASHKGDAELIQMLVQAGADSTVKSKNGQTPTDLADLRRCRAIMQDALDNGLK